MQEDHPAEGPSSPGSGGPDKPGSDPAPTEDAAAPPSLAQVLEPAPADGAAEAFKRRANLAEDRLAEVLAAYRSLKQENEAFRERTRKNLERRYDQRRERLLLRFIEILDNLDRALEAAQSTQGAEPLIEGLILVRTQLLQTLQGEGLERIPVLGLTFDPTVSEAVQTQVVDEAEHHQVVVKELQRGYVLNGRIARASRVVVGVYNGTLPAPAAEEPLRAAADDGETMPVDEPGSSDAPPSDEPALPPTAVSALMEAPREEAMPPPSEEEPISDLGAVAAAAFGDDAPLDMPWEDEMLRDEDLDISPPRPPAPPDSLVGHGELSLEEIVARAEAQEALFPTHFPDSGDEGDE